MNKYIILGLVALTVSCNESIDIDQVGRLGAEQAFQSLADLESGILGTYNQFDYTPSMQWASNFTDEIAIGPDNGGQGQAVYSGIVNTGSAVTSSIWQTYYDALNSANRIIEAADLIEAEEDEVDAYNNVLGEAYALRAWGLFELWSYYTINYTDGTALSALLVNFVPEVATQLPRATSTEFLTQIGEDLTTAAGLLTVQSSPTRVSQDFVTALRAKVALYTEDYTTADALAASLLANYPISNTTQFEGMWDDSDDTEIIFKLERSVGDPYDGQGATGSANAGGWAGANYAFVNPTVDGSPYFVMSSQLFDLMPDGDIRREVYVDESAAPDYAVLPVGKYPGSGGQPLLNDLKIFRSADMLLIRAEAAASSSDFAAVATFIDELRDARFGTDVATPAVANQTAAFAAVLEQRRIEFAFEGHRYRDLKRLGVRAGVSVSRPDAECTNFGNCSIASDDFRFTLPIPLFELDANPAITTQNPGYEQ
ncbi:RagB/SusD family nutrient uptake outer membrane protein [Ekhidna sp.]